MDLFSYLLGTKKGIKPTGTINITENGEYDVTSYATANVNVSGGLDWSAIGYSETPESLENDYNYALQIKQNWDSSVTSCYKKFLSNNNLVYMPLVDTSNVVNVREMFDQCSYLTTIPELNVSNVLRGDNMLRGCKKLSDESLNNVLKMCINFNSGYADTKTLLKIFSNSVDTSIYPASRIQALPSYQAFIDAGWTIGY